MSVMEKICVSVYVMVVIFKCYLDERRGTRLHSWLRHCATSRMVADSIPSCVIGNFN